MNTLSLNALSKRFGGATVLNKVTLSFLPGSVTAIVGDNGAGKSTLLKTISGAYQPEEGQVFLAGQDLTPLSATERRRTGIEMVYQDLALAPGYDAVTNLFIGRELTDRLGFLERRAMERIAQERLTALGIEIPDIHKPVGTLSGGQQQAISIARALLFDPRVLLLDEPTAALAAREVGRVLELIRGERERNRIVILISHRLNDVFQVADRIVVMKQGGVIFDTPAAETTLAQTVERIVG